MPGRALKSLADYVRLRDLASPRFRLDVRDQWLGQSYGESLHEKSVLHTWQVCKTRSLKRQDLAKIAKACLNISFISDKGTVTVLSGTAKFGATSEHFKERLAPQITLSDGRTATCDFECQGC
jgi:hypothetical protein